MEAVNTTARRAGLNYEDPMEQYAVEYIQRGKKEGREEGTNKVAKTMKDKGYPVQEIAELTGLSPEQIQAL